MELIDIGVCLTENAVGFLFARLLLSKRSRNILPLIAVIAAGTMIKFAFYNVNVLTGYLISAAIFIVGNMALFKDKPSKKVVVSMITVYSFCISDFIFGCVASLTLEKGYLQICAEWLIIKALCAALILPFFLCMRKIPPNSPDKFYSFFAGTMTAFGVVAAVVTGAFRGSAMNTSRENLIVAGAIALIFYGASVIVTGFFSELCISLKREEKALLLKTNFKYLNEQIDIRKENEHSLRKFRHDITNYLIDIRGLLVTNQTDSALKLLERIIRPAENATAGKAELPNLNFIDTGNVFADVVISAKTAVCRRKNIRFDVKSVPLSEYNIDAADMSSLLSNLLDNAIEAAEKADEPYITMNIFEHNAYVVFRVENSVFEDINYDSTRLKSTKKDGTLHGCGTEIIREIAEKYNGSFVWKSENRCFSATVLIKK